MIVSNIQNPNIDRKEYWEFTKSYKMNDRNILDGIIGIGKKEPISGPWRLTVWDSSNTDVNSGKVYVFSEEHHNEGSCPEYRHFSSIAKEILDKTKGVHILVENFIHANDLDNSRTGGKDPVHACAPVEEGILNNLRNCLEVMRINKGYSMNESENRIHFIDPRVDMVSILPDGKIFQAITHYTEYNASKGNFSEAVLTIYEALVHPLSSLLPDKKNLKGRLVGSFDLFRSKMSLSQGETFDKVWKKDITGGIIDINSKYVNLMEKYVSNGKKNHNLEAFASDVEDIKQCYKEFTNKFLDVWLLAHVFMIQNTNTSNGMVMYLGSLHGIQIEHYLKSHGFDLLNKVENGDLDSCLTV